HLPAIEWAEGRIARSERRARHFLTTDPEGSWVAEQDSAIVGLAQAHQREGLWVLGHLFVAPWAQSQGVGRALLERALRYGDPGGPALIMASRDPRAMRRYALAGFELRPALAAGGRVDRLRLVADQQVRDGSANDLDLLAGIDRRLRGASRSADHELSLREGDRLLLFGDRAYAFLRGSRVSSVGGLDADAAARCLMAALAEAPPGPVSFSWVTGAQQWAVRVALEARLELHPHGPVMVRGDSGPLSPYLPDGAFG
ncbi:MAG: GNAT family N-acetyltransferase, partial [Acidimicrobiia bacterium]|nr:GNAT family N-acetyltransferase [Acidimicrobiia bacterium]